MLGSGVTLLATVFVIPSLDSITGLLMLTLPTIAIGAWVAAGSPRINYVGLQFVFAYALALLGRFGPTTDLTEVRDRLIGILIGVAVSMFVYSTIWPEREGSELRNMLARLLRSVAGLARAGRDAASDAEKLREIGRARLNGWSLLAGNREMQARIALEPGWQYAHDSVTIEMQTWFAQAQEALFAVNWLQTLLHHAGPKIPDLVMDALEAFRENAARRLERLADDFEERPAIESDTLAATAASLESVCAQARNGDAVAHRIDELVGAARAVHERIAQLSSHSPQPARPKANSDDID